MSGTETVLHAEPPRCDFSREHGYAAVDGKTQAGAWANMCAACWDLYGIGRFGTGYGQRLMLDAVQFLTEMIQAHEYVVLHAVGAHTDRWMRTGRFVNVSDCYVVLPPCRISQPNGREHLLFLAVPAS